MPKRLPRIRPDEELVLQAEEDDFPLHPPKGPRRFVPPTPLWRRILMRPSLYFGPVLVCGAIGAFVINALILQSGPRGTMTLGWPFNAISKTSLEKLNPLAKDQPVIPLPPKRTDAGDLPASSNGPKAQSADANDPYANLLKDTANGDPALERAQRVLNRLGYGPIPVDGAMSQSLRAAIQRFGRDRGLTPGPQTETAILKHLGHAGDSAQD